MNAPTLPPPRLGLVGDIGGTNARFALAEITGGGVKLIEPSGLPAREHDSVYTAAEAYLAASGRKEALDFAVLACAGPVHDGVVTLTNLAWTVDRVELERRFGVKQARVINDLEAVALAAPQLTAHDIAPIGGPDVGEAGGVIAVIGAGTGFNAAALVRRGSGTVVVGEAGHAGFAPVGELELEIHGRLAKRFDHVSVERVLSGPGIFNLYQALAAIRNLPEDAATPAAVSALADKGDALAIETLNVFCEALGSACANLALTFGAHGGIYIAGGIAPSLIDLLSKGGFRRRFEAKAPMGAYLQAIPTSVIVQPYAALTGAAEALVALAYEGA